MLGFLLPTAFVYWRQQQREPARQPVGGRGGSSACHGSRGGACLQRRQAFRGWRAGPEGALFIAIAALSSLWILNVSVANLLY